MTGRDRPRVRLITFGGGSEAFRQAAERVVAQARGFEDIDEAHGYTDMTLPAAYLAQASALIRQYPKGYGLWSWKPYLVYHELLALRDGDILVYVDAGCELNRAGRQVFNRYLSFAAEHDALFFELDYPQRFWTKRHPLLTGDAAHYFRNQIVGGIFFLRRCERTLGLAKAWKELCFRDDFSLLKDPVEGEAQIEGFNEHRYEQSCLSATVYAQGFATLADETFFPDWTAARHIPILAVRNRKGSSILQQTLYPSLYARLRRWKRRVFW